MTSRSGVVGEEQAHEVRLHPVVPKAIANPSALREALIQPTPGSGSVVHAGTALFF
jgi:hypothetical protein